VSSDVLLNFDLALRSKATKGENRRGAKVASLGQPSALRQSLRTAKSRAKPRDVFSKACQGWRLRNVLPGYSNTAGFTLIELVIATVILAIIAVSIYGSFSVGVKVWRRGDENRGLQKIRIALLSMQKELRGSFYFSNAPFKGASSEITFPLVAAREDKGGIYVVNYYVTEDKNTQSMVLMKRKILFSGNQSVEDRRMGELIHSMDFEYAYEFQNGLNGVEWKDVWEESQKKVPLMIRINFMFGADKDIYHKVIFIPQGALGTE